MKNKEINVFRRTLFLLVLIIVIGILTAYGNPSMIPVTVVPEIHVKALPAYITSVEFTVTGPGMEPLSASYDSLPDSINLAIPPGEDRYFELLVYVGDLLNLTPALSFKGSATVDLTPGDVVVELTMRLDSTKLVVPDFQNQRVIQFDDISGAGELILWGTGLQGLSWALGDFKPYDIDFDDQGKIYIANYNALTDFGRVIRVDNILGTNSFLYADKAASIVALTVDRNNDYLYYSSGSLLWRVTLDRTNEVSLGMDTIGIIRGMAIHENGILYIAGNTLTGGPGIFAYDPSTETVIAVYNSTDLATPWDTLVKGDHVYVANRDGLDDWKIIRLNKDLTSQVGYGLDVFAVDTNPGNFYGPRRFVAILNEEITIIDDRELDDLDKLVSIDDITGAGWTTFPLTGAGQVLFKFYSVGI